MFHRASSLAIVAILAVGTPLQAQIMVQRGSLRAQSNAPRLLVANPFTPSQADSAAAVAIGHGLRERLSRNVVGRDFAVITREQMNAALAEWGYPADAILNATTSKTFAIKAASRTVVLSTLARAGGGNYALTLRLVGTGEPAGVTVTATQEPGQKLEDFGAKAADLLRPAIRALGDARECVEQAATNPGKAAEAAEKAIKVVPNHGLAEYCLGALAAKRDSVGAEAMQRYRNATIGDPQAVDAYAAIGVIQQLTADSAGVVQTYQTMLRVDPTNQLLRDQAFGLFQRYGRPEAAEEVADEGIRLDPGNTDWYDLKSNACLAQSKFSCAVDELERAFLVDSTRADTLFFKKIATAAKFGEDTVRYLKWTQRGAERYPSEMSIADELAKAYAMSGMPDSAVAAVQRLLMLDETRMETIAFVTNLMAGSGFENARKAIAFVPMVKANGTEDDKNLFANILVNAASAARTAQQGGEAQAELGQAVLDVGATNPTLTSYAGFFILETLTPRFQELSQAIRQPSRSCTVAQEYQELLKRYMPAARLASTADNEAIKGFAVRMLEFETSETTAANQAVAAACR